MIFSSKSVMQPNENIRFSKRSSKVRPPLKTHHLSSFGILNRNGLEIDNGVSLPEIEEEKEKENTLTEFSGWSLPQQRAGYIQCRKHDFW